MGKIETTVCNNDNNDDDDDDDAYFSRLPDEIVRVIFNKILDLKSLCLCKPVSKKFNLMVTQVDTICFVASRVKNYYFDRSYYPGGDDDFLFELPERALLYLSKPYYLHPSDPRCPPSTFESESFRSAIRSMDMFTRLKSLCIDLPSTGKDGIIGSHRSPDLYKWKVKFGGTLESLVFLSPDSVCELSKYVTSGEEEDQQRATAGWGDPLKIEFAFECLMDAAVRFRMLLGCTLDFPLLEKVMITQSGNRGCVSINGRNNIVEMREWLRSPRDSLEGKLIGSKDLPFEWRVCCVPLLKLPVSGYLMKGVSLVTIQKTLDILDGDYSFYMNPINLDDFADKQEAAYAEAVVEMLKIARRDLPARPSWCFS